LRRIRENAASTLATVGILVKEKVVKEVVMVVLVLVLVTRGVAARA
jgi:hypothetical protein